MLTGKQVSDTVAGKPMSIVFDAQRIPVSTSAGNALQRSNKIRAWAAETGSTHLYVERSRLSDGHYAESWYGAEASGLILALQFPASRLLDLRQRYDDITIAIPFDVRVYIVTPDKNGSILNEKVLLVDAAVKHLEKRKSLGEVILLADTGAETQKDLELSLDINTVEDLSVDLWSKEFRADRQLMVLSKNKLFHPAHAFMLIAISVIGVGVFMYASQTAETKAQIQRAIAQQNAVFDSYLADWSGPQALSLFANEFSEIALSGMFYDRMTDIKFDKEAVSVSGSWAGGYPDLARSFANTKENSGSLFEISPRGWHMSYVLFSNSTSERVDEVFEEDVIPVLFSAAESTRSKLEFSDIQDSRDVRTVSFQYSVEGASSFDLLRLSQELQSLPVSLTGVTCTVDWEKNTSECDVSASASFSLPK